MVLVPLNFIRSRHLNMKNALPAHDAVADEIAQILLPRQDRDHPIDRTAMDSMNGMKLIRRQASWNRCMPVAEMILLTQVANTHHRDQVRITSQCIVPITGTTLRALFMNITSHLVQL